MEGGTYPGVYALASSMIGCWHDTVVCLSVRLPVTKCRPIMDKRYILRQKCLNK